MGFCMHGLDEWVRYNGLRDASDTTGLACCVSGAWISLPYFISVRKITDRLWATSPLAFGVGKNRKGSSDSTANKLPVKRILC